jgi:hypothetical protein
MVIAGGNISVNQHIIAGIHSKIITPSGGAHLKVHLSEGLFSLLTFTQSKALDSFKF